MVPVQVPPPLPFLCRFLAHPHLALPSGMGLVMPWELHEPADILSLSCLRVVPPREDAKMHSVVGGMNKKKCREQKENSLTPVSKEQE